MAELGRIEIASVEVQVDYVFVHYTSGESERFPVDGVGPMSSDKRPMMFAATRLFLRNWLEADPTMVSPPTNKRVILDGPGGLMILEDM